MPLLPAEPCLHPEDLFEHRQGDDSLEGRWWVMHTRPRQEKSLARQLHDWQIPFYLPLISRRGRIHGRLLTSYVPLFSGYVFVLGGQEERLTTLSTRRVVNCLAVPDQETFWTDLRQLERLLNLGAPVSPVDRLGPGTTVEIRTGPLAGLRGRILRSSSGHRFVVQVDFIQRGASVLMEDFNLELVATAADLMC